MNDREPVRIDGVTVGFVAAPTAADRAMLASILQRYARSVAAGTDRIAGPVTVWHVSDRD